VAINFSNDVGLAGIQQGNTANRPQSPVLGVIYYNTQLGYFESYTDNGWFAIAAAPTTPTAVVATNVGGVAEVVLNKKTGFVTKKDTKDLAAALEKLIASKSLRTAQGKAAKAHATKAFSVEKMINAHLSLYKKLAK
jgi:glycosyltransferase involved in cell wall biosynthesis